MNRMMAAVLFAALPFAAACSAMQAAIDRDDPAAIDAAIARGEGPDKDMARSSPLGHACFAGKFAALKHLVALGADVNREYKTLSPLYMCAVKNRPEMVKYLLSKGARPTDTDIVNLRGWTTNPASQIIYDLRNGKRAQPVAASHGNLDDDAYNRMRAAAGMPPERKEVSSDIDAPARRGAERPDDFALVVGIEDYQSVPKADYGARDGVAVRRHLEALGFAPRNIISLTGQEATGSKLKSYLEEWLPLNVKPSSTLFVYYSGHGAPDIKTGDAYLVPWDGDPKFLKSTALPLTKLYADLAKTKAKRVIVALDACFSGAGGRSVLAKGARPLIAKLADTAPAAGNLTVLAAASGDEITGSLDEQGHGMFTYHLLKGLSADPKASARSLFDYMLPKVQDDARRQNRVQTPVLAGASLSEPLLP